ncbi:MAG TPA: hypothetical protein PKL85_07890, partial [Bacteroidia bacterium]|nr:hypothetical protein [Bacteroidia bacterium]
MFEQLTKICAIVSSNHSFFFKNDLLIILLQEQKPSPENLIFWSLLPVVIAFSFIMFVIYRMRREAVIRSKEAEYKQHTAEVEMKALRAQMNPHFIFNA